MELKDPCSLEENLQWTSVQLLSCVRLFENPYASQEATELDMEQWTGSRLRKDYVKALSPAYMQGTSYIMPS